jgi:hypothetical protein
MGRLPERREKATGSLATPGSWKGAPLRIRTSKPGQMFLSSMVLLPCAPEARPVVPIRDDPRDPRLVNRAAD